MLQWYLIVVLKEEPHATCQIQTPRKNIFFSFYRLFKWCFRAYFCCFKRIMLCDTGLSKTPIHFHGHEVLRLLSASNAALIAIIFRINRRHKGGIRPYLSDPTKHILAWHASKSGHDWDQMIFQPLLHPFLVHWTRQMIWKKLSIFQLTYFASTESRVLLKLHGTSMFPW